MAAGKHAWRRAGRFCQDGAKPHTEYESTSKSTGIDFSARSDVRF